MSALIEHYQLLDLSLFIKCITQALVDPAMEIKMASHLILQKLVKLPVHVPLDLETFLTPLRDCVFLKTKETAVKQDVENNRAIVISALKTVRVLDEYAGSKSAPESKWLGFMKEIQAPESSVAELFKELTI
jgi:hypothetical protein